MFRTSICPSSGVQVMYCCMWCSALGGVGCGPKEPVSGFLGPQPHHLVLNTTCNSTEPELLKMDI